MQYTINEFRTEAFKEVYQVYKVFQDFFGEDSVDLQNLPDDSQILDAFESFDIEESEYEHNYNIPDDSLTDLIISFGYARPFILVYWPTVKVTNENDKSILIHDLYAKITLDSKGMIPTELTGFTLNRATYNIEQWMCGYLHSHINTIPKSSLTTFQEPCLGTGPIKDTIHSLKSTFSEGFDEIRWMLFCEELSRYVTVESLEGVPYNRLEEVSNHAMLSGYGKFNFKDASNALNSFRRAFNLVGGIQDFILYYLKNGHLAISYQQNNFKIGMSYYEYILDISNAFIDWFNKHYENESNASNIIHNILGTRDGIINRTVIANGKFLSLLNSRSTSASGYEDYIGKKVCTFKGNDITLKIKDSETTVHESIVFSHTLSMYILNRILRSINYHYANEHTKQHEQRINSNSPTTALPASTRQRVYYL